MVVGWKQDGAVGMKRIKRQPFATAFLLALLFVNYGLWLEGPEPALAVTIGRVTGEITKAFGAPTSGNLPTTGEVLVYDGTKWDPALPIAGAQSVALLDGSEHTDTASVTPVRGDTVVVNSSGEYDVVAKGGLNEIPISDGNDWAWGANDGPNVIDTLAATLAASNETGGSNIELSIGDSLVSEGAMFITSGGAIDINSAAGSGIDIKTGDNLSGETEDLRLGVGSASTTAGEVRLATTNAFGLVLGHASMAGELQICDGVRVDICNTEDDGGGGVLRVDTINLVSLDQKSAAALNIGTVTANELVFGKAGTPLTLDGDVPLVSAGQASSDTDTVLMIVKGENSFPTSTASAVIGGDVFVSGGLGRTLATVVAFGNGATDTVTVTTLTTAGSTVTVLTEGGGGEFLAETDNDTTATNIALAITNGAAGIAAVASGAVVNLTAVQGVYALSIATGDATAWTVTNSADGMTVLDANGGGVDVSLAGAATTIKGTLNTDEAVTHDDSVTMAVDKTLRFGTGLRSSGKLTTLGAESATTVLSVQTTGQISTGLKLEYQISADDGTEFHSEFGTIQVSLTIDDGGVTASVVGVMATKTESAGTLTLGVWTVDITDDDSIEIKVASVSSLSQSTHTISWKATYPANVSVVGS